MVFKSDGKIIRVGIVGLGGAAVNMLSVFERNPFYRLTAAADTDTEILKLFQADHPEAEVFTSVEAIAASASIDLLYIATPTVLHSEHVRAAVFGRKHVLIEKPMAVSLEEADAMIAEADRNGVLLGVNVKHSFEPRVRMIRDFVRTGAFGRLRMIQNLRYVDWLYRPRTVEELRPGWGSGLLWRQGPHQLDLVRTIAGGMIRSIRGAVHVFDLARPVPGAYCAFIEFDNDVSCTVTCSGYDHFDSRAFVAGFDGAQPVGPPERYGRARKDARSHRHEPDWEGRAAAAERYGSGRSNDGFSSSWLLGGPLIASFDEADVRFSPNGLIVDGNTHQYEVAAPSDRDGRDGRLNTFYQSLVSGSPLPADGRWGKATQEALIALEVSSKSHTEMRLKFQMPTIDFDLNYDDQINRAARLASSM